MQIAEIEIDNLRCVTHAKLQLGRVNVIAHRNAQGGSTVVNAPMFALTGAWPGDPNPKQLVGHGANAARVRLTLHSPHGFVEIERTQTVSSQSVSLDGVGVKLDEAREQIERLMGMDEELVRCSLETGYLLRLPGQTQVQTLQRVSGGGLGRTEILAHFEADEREALHPLIESLVAADPTREEGMVLLDELLSVSRGGRATGLVLEARAAAEKRLEAACAPKAEVALPDGYTPERAEKLPGRIEEAEQAVEKAVQDARNAEQAYNAAKQAMADLARAEVDLEAAKERKQGRAAKLSAAIKRQHNAGKLKASLGKNVANREAKLEGVDLAQLAGNVKLLQKVVNAAKEGHPCPVCLQPGGEWVRTPEQARQQLAEAKAQQNVADELAELRADLAEAEREWAAAKAEGDAIAAAEGEALTPFEERVKRLQEELAGQGDRAGLEAQLQSAREREESCREALVQLQRDQARMEALLAAQAEANGEEGPDLVALEADVQLWVEIERKLHPATADGVRARLLRDATKPIDAAALVATRALGLPRLTFAVGKKSLTPVLHLPDGQVPYGGASGSERERIAMTVQHVIARNAGFPWLIWDPDLLTSAREHLHDFILQVAQAENGGYATIMVGYPIARTGQEIATVRELADSGAVVFVAEGGVVENVNSSA